MTLDDERIIEMLFSRDEAAITEIAQKYGAYLCRLAMNLLGDEADAQEAVSDAYLGAWNAIPPTRPAVLRHYLSRLTRNAALDKLDYRTAKKRGGDGPLEELNECIPDERHDVQKALEERELGRYLNCFLSTLPRADAGMFVGRCYYGYSTRELSERWGLTERQVKYRLSVTRRKLKQYLIRKGVTR